jgi:hypothetical protein
VSCNGHGPEKQISNHTCSVGSLTGGAFSRFLFFMSMTLATIITGVIVLALGAAVFLLNGEKARLTAIKVLRNRVLDGVLTLVAAAWFLWIVGTLGEADFGDYKVPLFIGFLAVAVGSWFYVRDFLGVRAAAVLWMLLSWHLLAAAFGHYDVPARLFAVATVYIGLIASLYFGALPFRVRDVAEWLSRHGMAARISGAAIALYGVWLCVIPVIFY